MIETTTLFNTDKKIIHLFLISFIIILGFKNSQAKSKGFRFLDREKIAKAEKFFKDRIQSEGHCASCNFGLAKIYSNREFGFLNLEKAYRNIHMVESFLKDNKIRYELSDEDISESQIHKLLNNIEYRLIHKIEEGTKEGFNKFRATHKEFSNKTWLHEIAFEFAEKGHSVSDYSEFINRYPNAAQVPRAAELRNLLSSKALLQEDSTLKVLEIAKAIKKHEVSEEEKLALLKEKEAQEKAADAQTLLLFVILGAVLSILIVVILAYLNKKKANERIAYQKIRIEKHKDVIEEVNKQLIDSINYAKIIQTAILPSAKKIKKNFTDAFILYRPKDIVSGDFYWFSEVNGKKIIAAVDCTGHGVPGAFMSMIGNTLLNQIVEVKGLTKPSEILNELRKNVIKSLNQGDVEKNDGMDIALCVIHPNKIEFAGAFNPLVHISKNELTVIKGDRMPIGRHFKKENVSFTTHSLDLEKGDCIYIYSDGFVDQFGGDDNKKFSSKRFQKCLMDIHEMPCDEQLIRLETELDNWKGKKKQLDDILILGLVI